MMARDTNRKSKKKLLNVQIDGIPTRNFVYASPVGDPVPITADSKSQVKARNRFCCRITSGRRNLTNTIVSKERTSPSTTPGRTGSSTGDFSDLELHLQAAIKCSVIALDA